MPGWVPDDVRLYLDHVEGGQTIRALARSSGVHASTVLRKVRKTESRRDDPLVDKVLIHLGRLVRVRGDGHGALQELPDPMTDPMNDLPIDEQTLTRDATRILRALMRKGAVLAVVPEVETAVVVEETEDGRPHQTATVSRKVAEAMALQQWIACTPGGRVARYYITAKGRGALNRLLAEAESARAAGADEAPAGFGRAGVVELGRGKKRRAAGADTPLNVLARRRDKAGRPYLSPELVRAGERLRMDFEIVMLEGLPGSNWNAIMAAGGQSGPGRAPDQRHIDARRRLQAAMKFLGPELGEIALLTCCHEKGMESTEKELGMPARSGKYVLRIALNMLARHYQGQAGSDPDMIY